MTSTNCCNRSYQRRNHPKAAHRLTGVLAGLLLAGLAQAQTLFTYGTYAVSKDEFRKSFDKNAPASGRRKAMEEYLPLYINYKLKVQAAYREKLDTLPGQREEMAMYREQLADNILLQRSAGNRLEKEAFDRSGTDILLGHIYLPFQPGDSTSLQAAGQRAREAHRALQQGSPFAQVANRYNENGQPADGVAGWITAFSLPYSFETAVYQLPQGGYTAPLMGSDGFHLFGRLNQRPAAGRVQVAQILLWLPAQAGANEVSRQQQLADSLHQALQKGAHFEELVLQFSNDRTSYSTGGVLPEFGVGEYESTFETAAFALQQPGQISRPFRTSFGIHILKLLSKQRLQDMPDSLEAYERIRLQVANSGRLEKAKEDYLRALLPKMGYRKGSYKPADLWRYTDSALRNASTAGNAINKNTVLFSLGTEKTLAENWILYLRAIPRSGATGAAAYESLWNQYLLQTAEDHYKRNIAQYEPSFREQLREFKDANLLFQAMDLHVWSAAAADTLGLQQYYAAHRAQYVWGDGATALSVSGTDSAAITAFRHQLMQQPQAWRELLKGYEDLLLADSGRFELSQLPVERFTGGKPQAAAASHLYRNPVDNNYSFTYIFGLMPGGAVRSFEEARGWVISDYQQVLEKKWIEGLKKQYPVKVNQAVWQSLLQTAH